SFVLFLVPGFMAISGSRAQSTQEPVKIAVDLRDVAKHLFHSTLLFPVKSGPLTLVYPKWIQGEHSPTGPIVDLMGLKMRAAGHAVAWRRDDVDMYLVTLYPQGPKSDDLTYVASLRLPSGWKYGTALPVAKETSDAVEFAPASLTTLIDSPVIAGAYFRTIDLAPGQKPEHFVHIAADGPAALAVSPAEVQHMRQLVAETGALFGARHYRRYDFLLSLSDVMPPDGVEHHESSDDRAPEALFLDPEVLETQADLLAHEFTHSWNGKYRRPAGLVASDYQTPLKGELLWVYEGLTQYLGVMLAARSGFWTPER